MRKGKAATTTPSRFQIGDLVDVNFFAGGRLSNCLVGDVHFSTGKVHYSIHVPFDDTTYTPIHLVDSYFVVPAESLKKETKQE